MWVWCAMDQGEPPPQALQFDVAEIAQTEPRACAGCNGVIYGVYFEINCKRICLAVVGAATARARRAQGMAGSDSERHDGRYQVLRIPRRLRISLAEPSIPVQVMETGALRAASRCCWRAG
jgi:hypothetical protein